MTTETTTGKKPTHIAYHVRESKDGKGYWTPVGSAWAHGKGSGFNVQLDVVPLDGRIVITANKKA